MFQETFSGRNKSNIMYTSCIKWTCLDDGPQSGFAMLVLDIPSGWIPFRGIKFGYTGCPNKYRN